ncbi:MAG: HNH endonuclease signature motif containing protein [Chloroflexota bacterium]
MSPVKKQKPISPLEEHNKAISALEILYFEKKFDQINKTARISDDDSKIFETKLQHMEFNFQQKYDDHSLFVVEGYFLEHDELFQSNLSVNEIYEKYIELLKQSDTQPLQFSKKNKKNNWLYKGFIYKVQGTYSDDQIRLLILEDFDKEREFFENLKEKFDVSPSSNITYDRPRIPENIRIEVWRRDSGKCARCGSREKLEYDHIVPISKGGSNTARNIELLCEKHNRSKSNNVV